MAEFRVTYDAKADAAYIYLGEVGPSGVASMYPCDPIRVGGMINLDFDDSGRLVGVEVLGAASKLPRTLIDQAERV
ncbi:uncharacterized protein YuzE [Micromonospora sp. Llam0]|uniref:DUF2283 domain-containing protein n=1 Tax=Micromonospora sp. Llam0 TaxID=2485143 RepID=UPI000F4A7790|nr:uncharacterized protein YuzE [Micromonospora sp. Llam0]